ncbi:MAG: hypothetical protein IJP34_02135 [Clostridia bacterium]|nr:hypothetical protein [Clostridia bacterium]
MEKNMIKDRLFHDQGYIYFSPLEPKLGESITVRLQSSEKLLKAEIEVKIRNSEEDVSVYPMSYEGKDKIENFDLWIGKLPAEERQFYYRFRAYFADGDTCYYNVHGETEETEFKSGFYVIPGFSTPDWSKGAFWYSIMPTTFYNGNILNDKTGHIRDIATDAGDTHPFLSKYGGDLEGITKNLDYIKDLGVDAVFINPIWRCADAGGYGPDNFDMLDTAYGTDAELCELTKAVHEKGLKIMLDAVIVFSTTHSNFVNQDNEWPEPGAFSAPDNKYCDYFFFKHWPDSYQNYFSSVDFDYSKNCAKDYMFRNADSHIQRYLTEPYNIDAWRFDSASLLWGQGMTPHDVSKEIKPFVKKYGKDKLFLSECFCNTDEGVWETCWNMHHLFNLREWMMQKYDLKFFLWKMRWSMNERTRPFALSMYTHFDNHDVPRLYPIVKDKNRLIAGILCYMTYIGSPVLFYGDEAANKDINFGQYHNFNWNTAEWDGDYYRLYKTLSSLRKAKNVFHKGIVRVGYMDNENEILVFGRYDDIDAVITVLNPTENAQNVTFKVDVYNLTDGEVLKDIISGESYTVKNSQVTVSAQSGGAVLVKDADNLASFAELCADNVLPDFSLENIVPKGDWTYRFTVSGVSKNGFTGVYAGEAAENAVFTGVKNFGDKFILSFGRKVNGHSVTYFEKELNDKALTVQLQRIGTRYSVVYSTEDGVWSLLGDNLFANYSCTVLEHIYENSDESTVTEKGFNNTPLCPHDFDGDFSKYFSVGDLLKTEFVGNCDDFSYINGGLRQANQDGFHALMCRKSLSEYRMNVVFRPTAQNGEFGAVFGADAKGKNGYRFAICTDGKWNLYRSDKVFAEGKIDAQAGESIPFVIDAFAGKLVVYNGSPLAPICQIKLDDIEGYIGYYTDNTSVDILNYAFCDLSPTLTKQWIYWNVEGNKASMSGTGQINLKGCAYTNFETSVNFKLKEISEENIGLSGVLVGAYDGFLPNYGGLFFAVSTNGEFLLKSRDEVLLTLPIDKNAESHSLKIKANCGNYSFCVDGGNWNNYSCEDFKSGVVSLCALSTEAEFSNFIIKSKDM